MTFIDEKNMIEFFELPADEQAARLQKLAVIALRKWNVTDVEPRLIKFRENAVFEVIDGDGNQAVLRVHRQGYHDQENLESELKWMSMLSQNGISVPKPVMPANGRWTVDASSDDVPGVWKVDMLSWLSGQMLGEVGEPLDISPDKIENVFGNIGKTTARLHNLTAGWPEQNDMIRHAWDKDGLVGDSPLWGRFWELAALTPDQVDLLQEIRKVTAGKLDDFGRNDQNYGLIHADLVPENVFVAGDDIQLIDFDDAGFGWHLFEIATALMWLRDEPEYATMERALLDGYQSERPLSQKDLDALPLFFVVRSLTYLGWIHTRQNTVTAQEMTPFIVEMVCGIAQEYLNGLD